MLGYSRAEGLRSSEVTKEWVERALILGCFIAALAVLAVLGWLGWDLFLLAHPD
jgi:hypothetical protein